MDSWYFDTAIAFFGVAFVRGFYFNSAAIYADIKGDDDLRNQAMDLALDRWNFLFLQISMLGFAMAGAFGEYAGG